MSALGEWDDDTDHHADVAVDAGDEPRLFYPDVATFADLGTQIDGGAVHGQAARIRLHQAGQHLDECAFPGAILAQQRHHLAGPEFDADIRQGLQRAVALGQTSALQS